MTCQPVVLLDYITGLWEAGGLTAINASSMFVRDSFLVCGLRLPVRVRACACVQGGVSGGVFASGSVGRSGRRLARRRWVCVEQ